MGTPALNFDRGHANYYWSLCHCSIILIKQLVYAVSTCRPSDLGSVVEGRGRRQWHAWPRVLRDDATAKQMSTVGVDTTQTLQLNGIAIRNSKSLLLESGTITCRGTISDIAFINSCYQMRSCPIVCDIHSISISSIEFAKSMRSVVVSGSPGSISRFEHDGSKSGGRETNIVESVSGPSRGDCCRDPDCWGDG